MKALLSLGSNLGDRVETLLQAIDEIKREHTLIAVSSLYETSPVGEVAQDNFLNAACEVTFTQSPLEFLNSLHAIENQFGRTREVHWGPRTLDIDIVDIEGFTSDSPELCIPHPQAVFRKFVLTPCAEIAPEWLLNGESIAQRALEISSVDDITPFTDARWPDSNVSVKS